MKTNNSRQLHAYVPRRRNNRPAVQAACLGSLAILVAALGALADQPGPKLRSTWPQAYSVERNEASGILTLRTPYYTVAQDLKKGGAGDLRL